MKLEIEKNLLALTHNFPHKLRPFRSEELATDFEEAHAPLQLSYEVERVRSAIDVECNDDLIHYGQFSGDPLLKGACAASSTRATEHLAKPLLLYKLKNLSPVQEIAWMLLAHPPGFGARRVG